MNNSIYKDFLEKKKRTLYSNGFECNNINKILFPFQEYIVKKALLKGRYAIFADCGLGKTFMQLEWANQINKKYNKKVIIFCPLAVAKQTINEGKKLGVKISNYNDSEIVITNYEQIDNINASDYGAVVLDESSILKNYEGSFRNKINNLFKNHQYKLCCTATPSPNDPMELGNHAEFLNIMSRSEMLSMYFLHDGGETSKWRIKRHAISDFYNWVSEWSIMLTKPSDIGFKDDGYNLPSLNYINKEIKTRIRNGYLFNELSISATKFNEELRLTKIDRLSSVIEIINKSNEQFIVWVKQNEESEYLKNNIDDSNEVKGSDSIEHKEEIFQKFKDGDFRVLITKQKIAQYGLNFQNCNNQIFASLDFSFESLYQSIRRSYRFGQKKPVNIYLITTDTMQNVLSTINKKEQLFKKMQLQMAKNIKYDNRN